METILKNESILLFLEEAAVILSHCFLLFQYLNQTDIWSKAKTVSLTETWHVSWSRTTFLLILGGQV